MKLKKKTNLMPKVLVSAPTSSRHSHLLDEWLGHLDKLTYPEFDVLLVDTTPDTEDYFNLLKTKKVHNKNIIVLRRPWNYKKDHVLQLLAYAREDIRQYFLKNEYDYLFFLDTDIFIPENSIQKLLSRNKELVGFYTHIFDKEHKMPCVLKSGEIIMTGDGVNFYTFDEIDAYKDYVKRFQENKLTDKEKLLVDFIIKDKFKPELVPVYALGTGCLMISKNVLEQVPFRTHPTFILGEDIWFFNECNDKKFQFFCDTSVRAEHKNVNWNMINIKGKVGLPRVYIAMGPSNAKKAEFIKPTKQEDYTETETKVFVLDKGYKNEKKD